MRIRYALTAAAAALLLAMIAQVGTGQQVTARSADADWPMMNRDPAGTRYSPLTQINTTNATQLARAWSYRLQPETGNLTGTEAVHEATPIVVSGVMYLPAGNRVVALEPDTGGEIWPS